MANEEKKKTRKTPEQKLEELKIEIEKIEKGIVELRLKKLDCLEKISELETKIKDNK
jgi:SMC interacting uncharacterized protein involved in chromosome segregation